MWWFIALTTSSASALTLEDALRAADDHGAMIAAAEAGVDISRGQQHQARAVLLPKLAVGAGATWNDEEMALDIGSYLPEAMLEMTGPLPAIVVQPKTYAQASAALIVPIVDASGFATLHAAGAQRAAAEATVGDTRLAQYGLVAQAYIGLRSAREAVAVADAAISLAEHQVALAEAAEAAGIVPPYQRLDAQLRLSAARRDRAKAAAGVVEAGGALERLTQLHVAPDEPLEAPVFHAPAATEHPALVAAQARVDAARAARLAVRLDIVPDVSGQFTAVTTGNKGFSKDNQMYIATASVTWMPWDGGYRGGKAEEASARLHQAEIALSDTQARLSAERATTAVQLETAETSLVAAREDVAVAEDAHARAEAAFQAGAAPFIDVERAALGVTAARLALLQVEAERDLAVVAVYQATGAW